MTPPDDTLDDFLDHVCAPLVGVVPFVRRRQLRAELRELVEMRIEDGLSPEQAIRELGDPHEAGLRFQAEWEQQPLGRRPGRWFRTGMAIALAHFGIVSALILTALFLARYEDMPEMAMLGGGLSGLGPLAGVPLGWLHPARAAQNAALATSVVGLHALLAALTVGVAAGAFLRHAAIVFLVWLPLGALFASWSAEGGRRVRRRRFWREHLSERKENPSSVCVWKNPHETRL